MELVKFIETAIKHAPRQTILSLSGGAFFAVAALVLGWTKDYGVGLTLGIAVAILVFGVVASAVTAVAVKGVGSFLTWALSILFIAVLLLCISALFFGWPREGAVLLARTFAAGIIQDQIQPAIDIKATITPTAIVAETRAIAPRRFDTGKPGDCGINQDVSQKICATEGWAIASFSLTDISVNGGCGSSAGPASASGDACVLVPGTVRGCGWGVGAFGIRDCKGRGWVSWTLNATERRMVRQQQKPQSFELLGALQNSFTFRYDGTNELDSPTWSYMAKVAIVRGERRDIYEISSASEKVGPVTGRLMDGILSVSIQNP